MLRERDAWDQVSFAMSSTMRRGTGARRQRDAYEAAGSMADVVDLIVERIRPDAA